MVPQAFEPMKFDCIPGKKKETHTVGFSTFHFHLYSSVAQSSFGLNTKIHLIWSKPESVISLLIMKGSNQKSQMFKYEVWPLLATNMLYSVGDFIDCIFYTKKSKLGQTLLYAFLSFVGVQCV